MTNPPPSAIDQGLLTCGFCGTVCHERPGRLRCPQCGAVLAARKPESLARTWAFLIAAIILYVPANVLPVMSTTSLMGTERDTIISGVIYFWKSGSPELAVLIFSVSILIPMLKMGALGFLALIVHMRWSLNLHHCMWLFRVIEFVGRWSMLDVFVVALMVGLVRFRSLATIEAGPGAIAFGSVVILTMLATHSFDPRLLWDTPRRA